VASGSGCPVRRTALLLSRWTGARRSEIRRLSLDCLDAYPDGYPRLRIPVGKGYSERMAPLHPQAADELRHLIHHVRDERLLTQLGEDTQPNITETCH
jgi:integrase